MKLNRTENGYNNNCYWILEVVISLSLSSLTFASSLTRHTQQRVYHKNMTRSYLDVHKIIPEDCRVDQGNNRPKWTLSKESKETRWCMSVNKRVNTTDCSLGEEWQEIIVYNVCNCRNHETKTKGILDGSTTEEKTVLTEEKKKKKQRKKDREKRSWNRRGRLFSVGLICLSLISSCFSSDNDFLWLLFSHSLPWQERSSLLSFCVQWRRPISFKSIVYLCSFSCVSYVSCIWSFRRKAFHWRSLLVLEAEKSGGERLSCMSVSCVDRDF